MAKKQGLRIISLFSGAGGFDLGMIQANHKVVWANDFDADAVKTYSENVGKHIVQGDVTKLKASEIPDADCIIGGFPCQGFSQANMLRNPGDERNKLYIHFLRILKAKQPKYFLAENVRGILSMDGGLVIRKIVSDFRRAGYVVDYKLFNAADFGVPQNRKRVVIWGTRNDLPDFNQFIPPVGDYDKSSFDKRPWVTVGSALKGIPEPSDYCKIINHIGSKYKVTNRNFTGHRTTDPNKPSPTILARGNGKGGVCAIQHPNNHRRMTIRESAVIQAFPMNFEFFGKMNSCYRQIGNAVPVLFAKALGDALMDAFNRKK